MNVMELIQKYFPGVQPSEFHDWRVFGPQSLEDTGTSVLFYDRAARVEREFEISIDGSVEETTKPRIAKGYRRGR